MKLCQPSSSATSVSISMLTFQWGHIGWRAFLAASLYSDSCGTSADLSRDPCSSHSQHRSFWHGWTTAMPSLPESHSTCWSGSIRWWTRLLGWGFSSSRYDHITPLLRQKHWLEVAGRIDFKLTVLCTSVYMEYRRTFADELCQSADFIARRRLRSASSSSLVVRRTRLSTIGDRAFPVVTTHVWNGLPQHVTSAPFHLFHRCFPWLFCVVSKEWLCHFGHVNRSCYYY